MTDLYITVSLAIPLLITLIGADLFFDKSPGLSMGTHLRNCIGAAASVSLMVWAVWTGAFLIYVAMS